MVICFNSDIAMGTTLSIPKTEKFSEDGENDNLRYGLSSMQGWRATMEDAVSNQLKFLCVDGFFLAYFFDRCIIYFIVAI